VFVSTHLLGKSFFQDNIFFDLYLCLVSSGIIVSTLEKSPDNERNRLITLICSVLLEHDIISFCKATVPSSGPPELLVLPDSQPPLLDGSSDLIQDRRSLLMDRYLHYLSEIAFTYVGVYGKFYTYPLTKGIAWTELCCIMPRWKWASRWPQLKYYQSLTCETGTKASASHEAGSHLSSGAVKHLELAETLIPRM